MQHLLLLFSAIGIVYAQDGPTVRLNYGTFQGSSVLGLDTFLGIPFAQAGRFELPKTPAYVSGIQQANSFGPACPQQALNTGNLTIPGLPAASPLNTSEDCLFVNVIKPSVIQHGVQLPVLFWIYGGSFEVGDTSMFNGSTVVARSVALGEPVIFVSANYRLNAFGFAASKEIKAAGIGNLGLRDQRFALRWIKNNIAHFGGDKSKVTIWGESAGAISVGMHMVVNGGNEEGLFRGGFMESGSPFNLKDMSAGQPFYDQLVVNTGCSYSADTLACLRTVPVDVFQAAVNKSPDSFSFMSLQLAWQPRVDGSFIAENPQDSIAKGAFSKVPFVTGDCNDEGTLFSFTQLNLTTDQEAVNYLHSNYVPGASDLQFQIVADLYPSDPAQGSPFDTGKANQLTPEYKRIAAFQGDVIFQAPRRFFLQTASGRQDTWSFLYNRGKAVIPVLGSFHSSDLAEFYASAEVNDFQGTDALVNFANTGNPNNGAKNNVSSLIFWPKYSIKSSTPPLLTFVDPNALAITADTFRLEAIQALTNLLRQFP